MEGEIRQRSTFDVITNSGAGDAAGDNADHDLPPRPTSMLSNKVVGDGEVRQRTFDITNLDNDDHGELSRPLIGGPLTGLLGTGTTTTSMQLDSSNLSSAAIGSTSTATTVLGGSTTAQQRTSTNSEELGNYSLMGLNVAGVAAIMLSTVFGVFHVDTFLNAYHLPLASYSRGNLIFSAINTANDLAGAWLVDRVAMSMSRTDLVGISGTLLAGCFLLPFFRWWTAPTSSIWDSIHFIVSLSLYDTMYSFCMILMNSAVIDNHHMSDKDRVQYLASSKVVNMLASFLVAKTGLVVFNANNLFPFRVFLIVLAGFAAVLFLLAQALIGLETGSGLGTLLRCFRQRGDMGRGRAKRDSDLAVVDGVSIKNDLTWRRIARDFWEHKNFRAWIGMEMLMEGQLTFVMFFFKTFVDRLVRDRGYNADLCDWLISSVRPLTKFCAVITYIPIRLVGYAYVYRILFVANICLSGMVLLMADNLSTNWIVMYLVVYPIVTGAVQSTGFYLAMSDMAMERKRKNALAGRLDEPSLAGMFMGVNALFCKPMESVLPTMAAVILDHKGDSTNDLFHLLVIPPLLCSILQFWSWRQFDLTPRRTARMREELQNLVLKDGYQNHHAEA